MYISDMKAGRAFKLATFELRPFKNRRIQEFIQPSHDLYNKPTTMEQLAKWPWADKPTYVELDEYEI